MNRTWLYRVIEVVPRRTRLNVATLGIGLLVLILTTCCHFHQSRQTSPHRHRRLRWYEYDDSNDGPAHAPRVIISPVQTTRSSTPKTENISNTSSLPETAKSSISDNHSLYIDSEWATPDHDFTAESTRFLRLIQTVNPNHYCPGQMVFDQSVCCLTEELNTGIIYSFNLDQGADVAFERNLLKNTDLDKIYVFNPNYDPSKVKFEFTNQKVKRDTSQMEAENFNIENDELAKFSFYKVALDTQSSQNPNRRWRRKTFSQIRSEIGHDKIDLMRINMKSSEWKVLRHWLETGEMSRIDQILVKVHLHWSGFGVTGDDSEIVHQWYNTISSMIQSGLKLVSSQPVQDGPKTFLGKSQFDTSCCYYLTFFRN